MDEELQNHLAATIDHSVEECVRATKLLTSPQIRKFIADFAQLIVQCYQEGGKLLIAGNGGSLCDAMHFAEEMTGFFRSKRKALPAIALSEPGHLTCVSNDLGYEHVFSRGVEAYGQPGDLFIALTTSGNSPNLVLATETAKERGLQVVTFLGKTGGALLGKGHLEVLIEGFSTSDRIQEAHMAIIHVVIEQVEYLLFGFPQSRTPELVPVKK